MKHLLFSLLALLPLLAFAGPPPPAPDSEQVSGAQPRWSEQPALEGDATKSITCDTRFGLASLCQSSDILWSGHNIRRIINPHSSSYRAFVADVTGGFGLTSQTPSVLAISGWHMWGQYTVRRGNHGVDSDFLRRLSYGAGLRLTHFRAQQFIGTGRDDDVQGLELALDQPRLTAINAAIQLRFRLTGGGYGSDRHPLALGFNIDLAGLTLGPTRRITTPTSAAASIGQSAKPVFGNLLLGNTRDRGTLNSEFFLSLRANSHLSVRAGLAHIATGYSLAGNRYQRFHNMLFISLSLPLTGDLVYRRVRNY